MDIGLHYQGQALRIDAALDGGLLVTDESLLTATIISLFTDKLAGQADELPATEDSVPSTHLTLPPKRHV